MFSGFTNLLNNFTAPKVVKMFEVKPTIIYVRASTQEQNVEAQQYSCEVFARENQLDIIKVVVEKCSAYKFESQKGLEKILSEHRNINLLVFSLDRLSRNVIKADGLLELFMQNEITLISCKERVSTFTAYGRHEFRSAISAAQYESELISERVKNSVKYRKENNIPIGVPKYGYIVLNKKLIKLDEEQKIIKFILTIVYRKLSISHLDVLMKKLLSDLGRSQDYAPLIVTIETNEHELGVMESNEKVYCKTRLVAELLNDYGIFRRSKPWTSVSVGKINKEAEAAALNMRNLRI